MSTQNGVGHFTHFEHIINHINSSENSTAEVTCFIMILLAKVKLNVEQMSEAVQDGFLSYESFSPAERKRLVEEFDSYLASIKN